MEELGEKKDREELEREEQKTKTECLTTNVSILHIGIDGTIVDTHTPVLYGQK